MDNEAQPAAKPKLEILREPEGDNGNSDCNTEDEVFGTKRPTTKGNGRARREEEEKYEWGQALPKSTQPSASVPSAGIIRLGSSSNLWSVAVNVTANSRSATDPKRRAEEDRTKLTRNPET
jgi:hypothetical protein